MSMDKKEKQLVLSPDPVVVRWGGCNPRQWYGERDVTPHFTAVGWRPPGLVGTDAMVHVHYWGRHTCPAPSCAPVLPVSGNRTRDSHG